MKKLFLTMAFAVIVLSLGFIPKRDDDNAGNCTASMFIGFAF